MTEQQKALLPDLVVLAMAGFAVLKNNSGVSEWSHPAIAAFRNEVEPVLEERQAKAHEAANFKWGRGE